MAMRATAVLFALLLLSGAPSAATGPKLAVILVVDQMRADYIATFQNDWTGGLKRLVTGGAWFTRAAYPYLTTITCAGHATIGTGAYPAVHGIFQNTWFERSKNSLVACTRDDDAKAVGYGKPVEGNDSPVYLRIPTFADEMRQQRGAQVVSLAIKARSAIMLAGHGGVVTWLSDSLDGWETSTAYATAPVAAVGEYVAANPIEADFGKVWELALPADRYPEADAGLGEAPPQGWTSSFPHRLSGLPTTTGPDATFYAQWERSPYADAYVGRMAAALAKSLALGSHDTTDVLTVSFSSPDLVGHAFGPRSREIRDMYVNLDRTIGQLLEALDSSVGRDQYVVALSADHGVTPIPEQLRAEGRDGGRLNGQAITSAIETAAAAALGPGAYVQRVVGNDIYLQPGIIDRLLGNRSAMDAVLRALESQPGVQKAFHAGELKNGTTAADPLLKAASLGWIAEHSGDIVFAPKPGWMTSTSGTTHGSANDDDKRVPVVFYGSGIKPGQYDDAATPADIVPTLAAITGVSLPRAQGRALTTALATQNATASQR